MLWMPFECDDDLVLHIGQIFRDRGKATRPRTLLHKPKWHHCITTAK